MNFSHLVMSGHSFGGATALLTLAVDTRFKYTSHFEEINSKKIILHRNSD